MSTLGRRLGRLGRRLDDSDADRLPDRRARLVALGDACRGLRRGEERPLPLRACGGRRSGLLRRRSELGLLEHEKSERDALERSADPPRRARHRGALRCGRRRGGGDFLRGRRRRRLLDCAAHFAREFRKFRHLLHRLDVDRVPVSSSRVKKEMNGGA